MKTEKIEIKGKEYKLKMGFGVMMLWEKEEGKDITEVAGKEDIMKLAYYSLQYNNEDFNYSYKYFVDDILDENPALFIQLIDIISKLMFSGSKEVEKKTSK